MVIRSSIMSIRSSVRGILELRNELTGLFFYMHHYAPLRGTTMTTELRNIIIELGNIITELRYIITELRPQKRLLRTCYGGYTCVT